MKSQIIHESFNHIINQHAWNVDKGHGSFLTLEFGTPEIEIKDPKTWESLPYPLNEYPTRETSIHGRYHLWIYCCNWIINVGGKQIANDESSDELIQNATTFINGQKLISVQIDINKATTKFKFDLGGELLTFNNNYESGIEMWMFFMPDKTLTFNNKGEFCFNGRNANTQNTNFEKIDKELINIKTT